MIYAKLLLITVFIAVGIFASSINILACSGTFPDVPFSYQVSNTDRVYLATLIKSSPTKDKNFRKLTFKVERTFKGESTKVFEVINLVEPISSCDNPLKIKKSETWILLANHDEEEKAFYVRSGSFDVSSNQDKINSKYWLDYLERVAQNTQETEIIGQVVFGSYYTLFTPEATTGGLEITAESETGQLLKTVTDGGGNFVFTNLKPEKYKIKIYFPYEVSLPLEKQPLTYDSERKSYVYSYETTAKNKECVFDFFVINKAKE